MTQSIEKRVAVLTANNLGNEMKAAYQNDMQGASLVQTRFEAALNKFSGFEQEMTEAFNEARNS